MGLASNKTGVESLLWFIGCIICGVIISSIVDIVDVVAIIGKV